MSTRFKNQVTPSRSRTRKMAVLCSASAIGVGSMAWAVSTTYVGPNNGLFSTPGNWSTGVAPNSGDDVYISPPESAPLNVDFDYGPSNYSSGGFNSLTIGRPLGVGQYIVLEEPALGGFDSLQTQSMSIGNFSGDGQFVQGGVGSTTNTVSDNLIIAGDFYAEYDLNSNSGTLAVGGAINIQTTTDSYYAIFNQSAGSVSASSIGVTGDFPNVASYLLSGGTLSTQDLHVHTWATFKESNGSATITGTLTIDSAAVASAALSDGTLTVGSLDTSGTPSNFTWTGGTLGVTGNGGLTIGSSGPLGASLSLDSTRTLNVTNALTMASGGTLSLSSGTLTVGSLDTSGVPSNFTWTGGTLQLTAQPLNFTSGSDVDASLGSSLTLGSGQTLIVDNWEWLYGEGAYISQNTGSSNSCQGLYIGPTAGSGSVADYFQDGGSLTSNGTPEYVGYAFSGGPGGIGYFYQYGGTNNTPELDVGYSNTGVIGEYDLYNGATLTVSGNEYLGVYSQGTFNQNGGTHAIGSNLYIGGNTTGAVGDFNLDGGYLDVSNVNVGGSAGQGAFTLSNGTATIFVNLNVASTAGSYLYQSGGSLSASGTSNNGLIEQTGGTSYLGILSGTGSTTIGGGSSTATMTVASLNQSSVTINAMGTLKVTGGSDNTVNTLTINGGQLDLTNTHLFIDYGGGPDPVSTIRAYLISGFAGGAWNGPGIDSSIAALPANSHYGIGYADGADGIVVGLSSGQIEIKYTLLGDADLDGTVTGSDFTALAGNLGKSGVGWDKGDFLYTGAVTGSDFTALIQNLGKSATGADITLPAADYSAIDAFAAANGLMADVPEPTSFALLGLAAAGVLARRRRTA